MYLPDPKRTLVERRELATQWLRAARENVLRSHDELLAAGQAHLAQLRQRTQRLLFLNTIALGVGAFALVGGAALGATAFLQEAPTIGLVFACLALLFVGAVVLAVLPRYFKEKRRPVTGQLRMAERGMENLRNHDVDGLGAHACVQALYPPRMELLALAPMVDQPRLTLVSNAVRRFPELLAIWTVWLESGKPIRQEDWGILISALNSASDLELAEQQKAQANEAIQAGVLAAQASLKP